MSFYKVIISKVAYVQAYDEEEAVEKAIQKDYIFMDENVEDVEPSCRSDITKAFSNWEGIYAEED